MYVGKAKTKFRLLVNNYKSKHRSLRNQKQNTRKKRFHSHYIHDCHKGIDDWKVTLFEKCETHKQLKEREIFRKCKWRMFSPFGLKEKRRIFILMRHRSLACIYTVRPDFYPQNSFSNFVYNIFCLLICSFVYELVFFYLFIVITEHKV